MRADKFVRKEVLLPESVVKWLEECAKQDDRKLKKYMEKVLINHAREKVQYLPAKTNPRGRN